MQLDHVGAEHFAGAASQNIVRFTDVLRRLPTGLAGVRLSRAHGLADLLSPAGPIGQLAKQFRGPKVRPVRAVLFDKSPHRNWGLGWHQDRTICVQRRSEVPGFGPWTTKAGVTHVAPPVDIIERMVTLRVHLDDVTSDNAPLLIAPGSHRLGLIPIGAVAGVAAQCGSHSCLALSGDVWVYTTPILHASEAARMPTRRRVLQIDYSADSLPKSLDWLGLF